MPIYSITDAAIEKAAAVIRNGGLAAFPTETVYGLGGDAYNTGAAAKIFEAKNRPHFDPLIVHIAEFETLEKIADLSLLDAEAQRNLSLLAEHFWPGPLTLILPKKPVVPELVTSGLPTVAVRMPAHDAARQLIRLSTGAVAAPSANPFGYLSPTRAEHVHAMLGAQVEIILDGGPSQVGLESTVLDICSGQPRILRHGGTPKESIEGLAGPVAEGPAEIGGSANSPGMMKSHYAPRIHLTAHDLEALCAISSAGKNAFLFFDNASLCQWLSAQKAKNETNAYVLSETGNLLEAAARLFEILHNLDQLDISHIYAQLVPEKGLGAAINDRLRKAAGK